MSTLIDSKLVRVCISVSDSLEPGHEPWYTLSGMGDPEFLKQCGLIEVYSTTLQFPRPTRREVVPAQVAALQAKIQEIRANAGSEVNKLEEQIGKLLSIGYEGGES